MSLLTFYSSDLPAEEFYQLTEGSDIEQSKYTRVAQHLAHRGHLQEELTEMIAYEITKLTESPAVGVYIRARHGCCENRGIRSANSSTQTTVLKGLLKTDPALKNEFMHNIQLQETQCGTNG